MVNELRSWVWGVYCTVPVHVLTRCSAVKSHPSQHGSMSRDRKTFFGFNIVEGAIRDRSSVAIASHDCKFHFDLHNSFGNSTRCSAETSRDGIRTPL